MPVSHFPVLPQLQLIKSGSSFFRWHLHGVGYGHVTNEGCTLVRSVSNRPVQGRDNIWCANPCYLFLRGKSRGPPALCSSCPCRSPGSRGQSSEEAFVCPSRGPGWPSHPSHSRVRLCTSLRMISSAPLILPNEMFSPLRKIEAG